MAAEDNPFFSWLGETDVSKMQIDLSELIKVDTVLNQFITGYVGSDTIPPCTRFLCWYVLELPFTVSQKQLDKLKVAGLDNNTRFLNPGREPTKAQVLNA